MRNQFMKDYHINIFYNGTRADKSKSPIYFLFNPRPKRSYC